MMLQTTGLQTTLSPMPGVGFLVAFALIQHVESKLPPKFIRASHGAQKALYATNYGYSVIPLPGQLQLETRVSQRAFNGRRKGVKRRRRPTRAPGTHYASKFRQYQPYSRKPKRRPRNPKRKPRRPKPRPVFHEEPDYYEQEIEDEYEYEDYEEGRRRPTRTRGYGKKKKRTRYDDDETAFSAQEPTYSRKPSRPDLKGKTRKLYSATIRDREPEIVTVGYRGEWKQEGQRKEEREKRPQLPPWEPNDDYYHDRVSKTSQEDHDIGFGQGLELVDSRGAQWTSSQRQINPVAPLPDAYLVSQF